MNLSKHLTLKEATHSTTAKKNGIDNTPDERQIEVMKNVAEEGFESVRGALGAKPIHVASFFRGDELNKKIRGSKTSFHRVKGDTAAIDMDADRYDNQTNADIFWYCYENLDYAELIFENPRIEDGKINCDWVHLAISTDDLKNVKETLVFRRGKSPAYITFDSYMKNKSKEDFLFDMYG